MIFAIILGSIAFMTVAGFGMMALGLVSSFITKLIDKNKDK